ncbi:hypothetical protein [Methylobacterium brachiatum]|uniref:hypothetical protein n=1 Tax=Methylobacterium brachiatum TaxID=269660 RepID=UPI0008E47CE2|nr:hypothetical protein [Methylobacterium brachiatum]SFI05525.1 hypothetical protein SAMN02799642_00564 [Methylobacterium brachiatum]
MARFPLTAAALEQEAEIFISGLLAQPAFSAAIQELVMASVSELKAALDAAKASVDGLTAKVGQVSGSGIDPADLDPVLAEVNTLRQTVEALSASLPASKAAQSATPAT